MKKIISIVLLIFMLANSTFICFAESTNGEYEKLLERNIELNMEKQYITRIECIELLLKVLDIPQTHVLKPEVGAELMLKRLEMPQGQPLKNGFADVRDDEQEDWLFTACLMGIAYGIESDGSFIFEPNREITWGEACAIIVRCIEVEIPTNLQESALYLENCGMINKSSFKNINDKIERSDFLNLLDSLLDYKSCFSYKYCASNILIEKGFDIYYGIYPVREQQNVTYEEIYQYRKNILNLQSTTEQLNDKISYKIFTDKALDIEEYIECFNFTDSRYIEQEVLGENVDDVARAICEVYIKHMPETNESYEIQMIHNPDNGTWIADSNKNMESPLIVYNENDKLINIYKPYRGDTIYID